MSGCQMDRPGQVVLRDRQRTSLEEVGLVVDSAQVVEDHRLIPDRVELVVDQGSVDRVESEVPEPVVQESAGRAVSAASDAQVALAASAALVVLAGPVALGVSAASDVPVALAGSVALEALAGPVALEESA